MKKVLMSRGADHTFMFSIFRELIVKTGIKEKENLFFCGCQGPCYAVATFLSFGIRDLNINLYFATDADIHRLWKLEFSKDLGIMATRKEEPVQAKVAILMSGLVQVPFQNILNFIDQGLTKNGMIIGETVVPGLFEEKGWDKKIPLHFIFEFEMTNPTAFALER